MIKRISAVFLITAMIIGLCPQTVYAENETGQAENSQQTAEQGEGYHFVDLELPKTAGTQSKAGVRAYGAGIPEKYDARSLIGTVRKQGGYQTCWSFAALASAEASLITKGYATNALDLSEYQLAYFFYHHVTDPLGNTEGDATRPLTKDFANQGGNSMFTTWALAGWQGAALESALPYDTLSTTAQLPDSLAYGQDWAHMQNAYWISSSDMESIKQMVMQYGAVNIGYQESGGYRNATYNSYYNPSVTGSGHAVTIVGWDDAFSKEHFNQTPKEDGAWLIRNSWGTDSGENGYFWMSYEDASISSQAFVFDFERADNYSYNYQYDGGNGISRIKINNNGMAGDIFKVYGSSPQILSAVSLGIYDTNVKYKLSIYKDPDAGNPTSGTLAATQSGTMPGYAGYYTIPLEKQIILYPGHTFSVVYQLENPSGNEVTIFVDTSYTNGGWISFKSSTAAGQSLLKMSSTSGWYDLHTNTTPMCARIKAFTKTTACLHTDQETSVTKADASKGTDGSITTKCKDCNITLSKSNISAPNKIVLGNDSYTYDGKTKEPSVKVYDKTGKVISAANYTISRSSGRKEPGTYTVKVTFKGNYSGTLSSSFKIQLGKVKGLKNGTLKTDSVQIKWNKLTGATNYQIYRYDPAKKKYVKLKTVSSGKSSYTDKKREAARAYKHKIRAYRSTGGKTSYSSYSDVLYTAAKPKKVSALTAKKKTKNSVKLTWKKTTRADGYQIYRYNSTKKKWKKVTTIKKGTTVTYTNKKLKSKKTYQYKVRAYRQNGNTTAYGSYSDILKVRTK